MSRSQKPSALSIDITDVENASEFGGTYKFQRYQVQSSGIVGLETTNIWRRYSDFDALRNLLRKLFPGLFVPPLPPKKFLQLPSLASWTYDEFLRERRADLRRFLVRCANIPAIRESHALQVFLRDGNVGFKSAVGSQSLEHCDVSNVGSALERLQQNFAHSVGRVEISHDVDARFQKLAEVFRLSQEALKTAHSALEGVYNSGAAFVSTIKELLENIDDIRTSEADFARQLFSLPAGGAGQTQQQHLRIHVTPQLASLREWTAYGLAFLRPLSIALRLETQECEAYLQLLVEIEESLVQCDRLRRKIGQLSQKTSSPKINQQLDQAKKEYTEADAVLKWRQKFLLSEEERTLNWRARVSRYSNCVAKVVQAQLMAAREQSMIQWAVAFSGGATPLSQPQSQERQLQEQQAELEAEEKQEHSSPLPWEASSVGEVAPDSAVGLYGVERDFLDEGEDDLDANHHFGGGEDSQDDSDGGDLEL